MSTAADHPIFDTADDVQYVQFITYCMSFKHVGKIKADIRKVRKVRTSPQNRLMHLFLSRMAALMTDSYGGEEVWTTDRAKRFWKDRFIPRKPVPHPRTGEIIGEEMPSTAEMSVGECRLFIEQLIDAGHKYFNANIAQGNAGWRAELEAMERRQQNAA